jgi:hypothetical protein
MREVPFGAREDLHHLPRPFQVVEGPTTRSSLKNTTAQKHTK